MMVIWCSSGSFPYLYHNMLYVFPVVAVQLKETSYTVSEENGTVAVCSVVSNVTEQAVQVVISTQPDSAEGQLVCSTAQVNVPNGECLFVFSIDFADFSPSQFTLTFEAGQSQCQCVQISIEDDSIYENLEMFHVLLENITSDVTVTMGDSMVIILDNDRKQRCSSANFFVFVSLHNHE